MNNNVFDCLKIGLLSYRSNPYCGGQGVYIKNLAIAIKKLGHHVEIISGPPYLEPIEGIICHKIPSLDLYNPENLFRNPSLKELSNPINFLEWFSVSTMGFPEPFTFGVRVNSFLKNRLKQYDIIHDNQSLSYGVLNLSKKIPVVATIHHPITKDRDISIENSVLKFEKFKYYRWYSFIKMQKRVSRNLDKIITVSESSKIDISKDFSIPYDRFKVIPNGINTDIFHPIKGIKREIFRVIVNSSSTNPLKGLKYLLMAMSYLYNKCNRHNISLFVIGDVKNDNKILNYINKLNIKEVVNFTGKVSDNELVFEYAKASVAVIPSLYEGFCLPAGEAMACGVPVIATNVGGIPEIVGESGILVPSKNYLLLAKAIINVIDDRILAKKMGVLGINRIKKNFSWINSAKKTIKVYKEVINCLH